MLRTIAAAALLALGVLAVPGAASADFSLFIGRPGVSLFAGDAPRYPPVVGSAPRFYGPPVVVERPYYVPVYRRPHKHHRKHWKHCKKHRGWHHWDD